MKNQNKNPSIEGFNCNNCNFFVPINNQMGTKNRNHCPKCLWSKHLDNSPGDRESDCLSLMQPISLTFKKTPPDKYGNFKQGELMIVHECKRCGRISINRIAADDKLEKLEKLFKESIILPPATEAQMSENDIQILTQSDWEEVKRQLFGHPNISLTDK